MENDLQGVILGRPFKEISGLEEDDVRGLVWLTCKNDKTIFRRSRSVANFKHWTKKQLNKARPLLEICQEDKANGYSYAYQKIKDKANWIERGHVSLHEMTNNHFGPWP